MNINSYFSAYLYFSIFILMLVSCKNESITNDPVNHQSTVSDIDGNTYHTVTIGTQTWMVENLKTTKYRNGEAIGNFTGSWEYLVTGAYSWYNNDAATYKATYGALYNYYAIVDSRNIAPLGWHVPTDAEWTTLFTYLGGASIAGGKLKETGTTHWNTPNSDANNSVGFIALPGGGRDYNGTFSGIGNSSLWWSSTAYSLQSAMFQYLHFNSAVVDRTHEYKYYGFSVRCLKD